MFFGMCGVANATPSLVSVIPNQYGETVLRQYLAGSLGGALSLTLSVTDSNPRMVHVLRIKIKLKGDSCE